MKKESSYQKMKRKYEEQVAEMTSDIKVLIDEAPFVPLMEVKLKWRTRFDRASAVMYGKLTTPVRSGKNFTRLSYCRYRVENQNGFNNALYNFFEVGKFGSYSKEQLRSYLKSWPTKYPCNVIFLDNINHFLSIYVDIEEIHSVAHGS